MHQRPPSYKYNKHVPKIIYLFVFVDKLRVLKGG